MSTNTYNIAAYAIPLEYAVAKAIYENHFNENYMSFALNASKFDNMTDDEIDDELCGINAEDSSHSGHSDIDHVVYEVVMLTDNENPYKEVSTIFSDDADIDHYFGISLADSGLGDKVNAFSKSIPQEAIDNFKNFVMPILAKYNITEEPSFIVVQQTS